MVVRGPGRQRRHSAAAIGRISRLEGLTIARQTHNCDRLGKRPPLDLPKRPMLAAGASTADERTALAVDQGHEMPASVLRIVHEPSRFLQSERDDIAQTAVKEAFSATPRVRR